MIFSISSKKRLLASVPGSTPAQSLRSVWKKCIVCAFLAVSPAPVFAAGDDEISNTVVYTNAFFRDPPQFGEDRPQLSKLSVDTEVFLDLTPRTSFVIRPFAQYTHLSDEDLHLDFRNMYYRYSGDIFELTAGISREFWGVTESRHLVDVLNQSDFAADFTGDTKLGQPMLRLAWLTGNYGEFSAYYLPVFREPAYASADNRPRLAFPINDSLTNYESDRGDMQPDYALRWSHNIGILDIGLHYFTGTQRAPSLTITEQGAAQQFQLIERLGIDAQVTSGALLNKLEYVYTSTRSKERHSELVAGFEYTFSGIGDTDIELGLLAEFLYDSRDELADHIFQRDIMTGVRLAFNDENSTDLLFTNIVDLDNSAKSIQLEFNRRIGRNFKIGLEGRWVRDTEEDPQLDSLRNENSVQMDLNWYF